MTDDTKAGILGTLGFFLVFFIGITLLFTENYGWFVAIFIVMFILARLTAPQGA